MVKKDDALKYIGDVRWMFVTYHNHKENAAWSGVVIYAMFVAMFFNGFQKIPTTEDITLWRALISSFLILVIAAIVLWYLYTQFKPRGTSAHINSACLRLSVAIMAMDDQAISDLDWKISIKSSYNTQENSLPQFILDEMNVVKSYADRTRNSLEQAAYLIIILTTLIGIIGVVFLPAS